MLLSGSALPRMRIPLILLLACAVFLAPLIGLRILGGVSPRVGLIGSSLDDLDAGPIHHS